MKRTCKRENQKKKKKESKKKFREKNFYFNGQNRIHPNTTETTLEIR